VATERNTPEHRERYALFCAFITAVSASRLVFIDESFCKTGMRREHAWAQRGERANGTKPFRSWKTVSLIGAVRAGRRPLVVSNEGAVNGEIFLRFVERHLVPWIRPGDIVVMDNLNFHKMLVVRRAIEAAGAMPIYLPTYSPELNPIEMLWSDLKRDLRRMGLNTVDSLCWAVGRLRAVLPLRRIEGWFRHANEIAEAQLK
jgi:transposase